MVIVSVAKFSNAWDCTSKRQLKLLCVNPAWGSVISHPLSCLGKKGPSLAATRPTGSI